MANEYLKIFVSAYACEPGLGSEIGVGWHWILEMSRYFEIWVLTRKSNKHTIDRWLRDNPYHANIHFLYFDLPKWTRFWKKGLRGVHLYYYLWQRCCNSIVKQTMQENGIEIFHHLTYGNALWGVSSYGQKQCFIWGPIGGLETIPAEFTRHYGYKSRLIEWVRRILVYSVGLNIDFKSRCRNANLILCKTAITQSLIPPLCREKSILFTDVAAEETDWEFEKIQKEVGTTNFLTVGRLDAWRGFDLIIEAFSKVVTINPDVHLTIIGEGIDKKRLSKLIYERKLESWVTMVGKVDRCRYIEALKGTDVVINASLKEGGVTVAFDSLSNGKPLVCIDTTGYTRTLTNNYSVLISRDHRPEIIENLTGVMLQLTDRITRVTIGINALQASTRYTWEKYGREIHKVITDAYNVYKLGK